MENPFIFGRAAEGPYFTDRKEDARRLESNLTHGIHTILISPRRWGKTSLVKKVIAHVDRKDIRFVFVDIFRCKSEQDFMRTYANSVIKQTSTKMEEWVETAKEFLSNISPKFSFSSDPMNDFSVSFDWNPREDSADSILVLPQRIAENKGIHLVICIDEFQQIAEFSDSVTFQKRLRSVWQHQQNVTYCMFGSKKHLMEKMFSDKSLPFYKFGDMIFLKKIPTEEWVPFICDNFRKTGKTISEQQASRICELTENLSSYVQHLSWLVWYKSDNCVQDADIDAAINDLLEQNKVFFQREVEQLTELQLNFMMALADGVSNGFSRKEIIQKYGLEGTANVQSIKKALIKKDLIYTEGSDLVFDDSLFKLWLLHQPR